MRTSSMSSAGYSYAKTNPPRPHHLPPAQAPPSNLPTSPNHYSHLRSRSGPSVLPQMAPLSSQAPLHSTQAARQAQRPVATTRLDGNTESLVVIQRQKISPPGSHGNQQGRLRRQESAPAICGGTDISSRPDPLSGVIDDLAKLTQELGVLEENIFTPG